MAALDFPTSPSNGDTYENYIYDGSKGVWRINPQTPGFDLESLSDTNLVTPADGQALVYDSATQKWINETPASTVSSLTDTTITTPSDGQALVYDDGTSKWINGDIAGGVEIASTAPSSPSAGDLWWDSDNGNLYVYYDDGTSQQWVSASDGQATISDTAPTGYNGQLWWNSTEGKMYVYYDDGTSAQWVAAGGPQVTVQATAPTGYQGQMWLDSTDGSMYVYYTDPGGASSSWIGAVSRSGGILQVVSTTKTDTFSTTSTSFTDVTGLSATITPKSTSSKIFVLADVQSGGDVHSTAQTMFRLMRDATPIAVATSVSNRTATTTGMSANQQYTMESNSMSFLDSPSTTSSVTYKVQMRNTTSTFYVNRTLFDTDNSTYSRSVSTITLIEVAG